MIHECRRGDCLISTDSSRLDIEIIHDFLTTSHRARGVSEENVRPRAENAPVFGLYREDKRVGFTWAVTDYVSGAGEGEAALIEAVALDAAATRLQRAIARGHRQGDRDPARSSRQGKKAERRSEMSLTIDDITSKDLVVLDIEAGDRWEVIDNLAGLLADDGRLADREAYVEAVRAREEETGGTAMEMGIAIPHAKSGGVEKAGVAFGRLREPLDFGAAEADLVFLIAAPEGEHNLHVTVLSQLARRLVHEKFRTALREAATPEAVVEVMREEVSISK